MACRVASFPGSRDPRVLASVADRSIALRTNRSRLAHRVGLRRPARYGKGESLADQGPARFRLSPRRSTARPALLPGTARNMEHQCHGDDPCSRGSARARQGVHRDNGHHRQMLREPRVAAQLPRRGRAWGARPLQLQQGRLRTGHRLLAQIVFLSSTPQLLLPSATPQLLPFRRFSFSLSTFSFFSALCPHRQRPCRERHRGRRLGTGPHRPRLHPRSRKR